ncbi:peptidoglycan-binding domain-containing protein [Streptomyces sp. NPDC019990]|uniref:peptidoglycan-binding domain-containing protein n=1 Tax=Streptomyces sp. NPDC019990 TaxID=3154693 RepID=UPI0033F2B3E7
MEPPNGHPCPECGAPRRTDRTPSCACAHRVAEALRDTRTAQAAAAEDFDPLLIRPYVELDEAAAPPGPGGHARDSKPGAVPQRPAGGDTTLPLHPVDLDTTTVLPASPATSVPPASATAELGVTRLRRLDGAGTPQEGLSTSAGRGGGPGRRRRIVLLAAAAGACVAVVTAAGYATGLFSYQAPSRDTALPESTRAGVPDVPASSAAPTPSAASVPATPSAPAAPPPSPTATPSASASPSPSAPSASPSPSRSATPSAPPASATASGPEQAPPDNSRENKGPTTLRLGDRGPEVSELQLRLRQVRLFDEDADGTFDDRLEEAVRTYQWSRGIQRDDLGVYDPETRAMLESETEEP